MHFGPCSLCKGARLNQAALSCKITGRSIAELSAMEVGDLIGLIKEMKEPEVAPMVQTLIERLQHLVDIGLEYLSLSRETDTLSGGESQRVKMVKQLNGALIDVLYVFDEPSIGLHPRDVHRLNELLEKLRDKGNTVIVVEHDPDVIKVADYIIDMGPHAGTPVAKWSTRGALPSFSQQIHSPPIICSMICLSRKRSGVLRSSLPIVHARANNLKDVSVNIPTGVLTVVTGVAGSGKSSLDS